MFVSKATKSRFSMRDGQSEGQKSAATNQKKEKRGNIPMNLSRFAALEEYDAEDAAGLADQELRNFMDKESSSKVQKVKEKVEIEKENSGRLTHGSMQRRGKKSEQNRTGNEVSKGQKQDKTKGKTDWAQVSGRREQGKAKLDQMLLGRREGEVNQSGKANQDQADMGRRKGVEITTEKSKEAGKRTYKVVLGNMGQLPTNDGLGREEFSSGPEGEHAVAGNIIDEGSGPPNEDSNRWEAATDMNMMTDAEPPDPGNQGDGEFWEEVDTVFAEDHMDDDEFVPETAAN